MDNNFMTITRKQLYDEIWEISLSRVAKKYDLHYAKFINSCKEYNIPTPTPSYWTKKKMGLDIKADIVSLPAFDKEEIALVLKGREKYISNEIDEKEKVIIDVEILDFLKKEEQDKLAKVIYELDKNKHRNMHKTISNYKNKRKEERREERQRNQYNPYYNIHDYVETGYFVNVSKFEKERFMKILSSIYYAIEELGGKVNDDFSIKIGNELVNIEIEELKTKVDHELTKEEAQKLLEYEDSKKHNRYAYSPNIRKYDYIYNGKFKITFESGNYIKETDKVKLETRIGDIIIKIYQKHEQLRLVRLEREEREKKEQEERKREQDHRNIIKEEAIKLIKLVNEAEDYRVASEIRKYTEAMELKGNSSEETKEWIEWANKKADWYDPTVSMNDEVFGVRDHGSSVESKNKELNRYASYYSW